MSGEETETVVALVEDRFGVLDRVVGMLRRRHFEVRSFSMGRSELAGCRRLTVTVAGPASVARRVADNLSKLVEVIRVEPLGPRPTVCRDLVLVKLTPAAEALPALNALCSVFGARVADLSTESAIVEMMGEPAEIQTFLDLLAPHGVLEVASSECVAMSRGRPSRSSLRLHAVSDSDSTTNSNQDRGDRR